MEVQKTIDRVIAKIIEIRKDKKLTLEFMAEELQISVAAYDKIEKQKTNLTFERLLQIQVAFGVSLNELLDLKAENIYHQSLTDHAIGHQEVVNLYNDNKEITSRLIKNLEDEIIFLRQHVKFEQ